MSIIKIIGIIIVSIAMIMFIAITLVFWTYNGELFFTAPSFNNMDRFLKTNIDELSYVASALFEQDYTSVSIDWYPHHEDGKYYMSVSREYLVNETVQIPDELTGHIQNLYERGVRYISSGRDYARFTTWSTMDESRGITYSRIGKKPDGEQLIEVRQLSIDNWFYYVHNYEKAKERNPHLFQ